MIKITVTLTADSKEEAAFILQDVARKVASGRILGSKFGFLSGNYHFQVEREIDHADNDGAGRKNKS